MPKRFCSFYHHNSPYVLDAFSIPWNFQSAYVFSLVPIVSRVVRQEQAFWVFQSGNLLKGFHSGRPSVLEQPVAKEPEGFQPDGKTVERTVLKNLGLSDSIVSTPLATQVARNRACVHIMSTFRKWCCKKKKTLLAEQPLLLNIQF